MKKKIIKWSLIVTISALIIGGSIVYYLFNMPHRDVQSTPADYKMAATELVDEYLKDSQKANSKYLQEEGESKIIAVTGTVFSIETNLNDEKVVLLKKDSEYAGVSCTFMTSTNEHATALKIGEQVSIKGVIRAGASYDDDMEIYEDVIMEKCDIYTNN
jgi:hypothetical protein